MVINALLSALLNALLLAGIPFLGYFLYHRLRHKRAFAGIARRAGLQWGERRYLVYSLIFSVLCAAALLIWQPPLAYQLHKGSAMAEFAGLGVTPAAFLSALLYGVIKTGFAEEFLFRGLIAGSLGRRLPLRWANPIQAAIFLLPHLLLLYVVPGMWPVLILVFAGGLLAGWIRIRSRSILGSWLIHATANVAMACIIIVRTSH